MELSREGKVAGDTASYMVQVQDVLSTVMESLEQGPLMHDARLRRFMVLCSALPRSAFLRRP